MGSLETFQQLRPHLMSVAYRMLGCSSEAEDVVQDAWLRWRTVDETSVQNSKAWLCAATSRLCLDRLKVARARRASYPGPWLPEPVITEEPIDKESISVAFLVLLERLTPVERAVYLLHHVFEYPHAEVAKALDMTAAAARQAYHRAKGHVAANRPRFAVSREDHERLLLSFAVAIARGDLSKLVELLSTDATLWIDGGGRVRGAARRPVRGGQQVARVLLSVAEKAFVEPDQTFEVRLVNGWPALVGGSQGQVNAVVTIETDGSRILAVRNVLNPEKLKLRTLN